MKKSSVDGLLLGDDSAAAAAATPLAEGDVLDYSDDGVARLRSGSGAPLSAEEEMEAILRLVDQAPEVAELDASAVRQTLLRFSRAASRNLEQRAKFATEPQKFMESELALDEAIRALHGLAISAEFYPLLLEPLSSGESTLVTLCTLLVHHENLDVACDCVSLLHELLDAETIGQEGEEIQPVVEFITGAGSTSPSLFLNSIVTALSRFPSEHLAEQSTAVSQLLGLLENLTDLSPQSVSNKLVRETPLLEWLLKRVRDDASFNANKLHASEILSIVLTNAGRAGQDALSDAPGAALGGLGIKTLIRLIARYRKEDPANEEEREYLENLFDALCVALHAHRGNQELFARNDGLQLMLTMIKRATYAKSAAFKALDYAVSQCATNAELFVDLGGLKTLFGALMFNPVSKKDKALQTSLEQMLLSLSVSLFLETSSVRYLRLMRKFTEADHIKTERVVELLAKYLARVEDAERAWARDHPNEAKEEREALAAAGADPAAAEAVMVERYARALEHGQAQVDSAAIILAFLATAGEAPLRERVEQLLNQQDIPLSIIQTTLRQYVSMMGSPEATAAAAQEKSGGALAAASASAAASSSAAAAAGSDGVDENVQALIKTKQVLEALAAMLDQPEEKEEAKP